MNDVVVLRAAERRAQPWKNGGGTTAEVYVHPPGSGYDDFEWRVSIADVAAAGPFSCFPGVDRILTVLDGELALTFEDADSRRVLTARSDPYGFAGDLPCHGEPLTGTVRDLNVMVRRAKWSARVERLRAGRGLEELRHDAGPTVLVAGSPLRMEVQGRVWMLAPMDAVLLTNGSAVSLVMHRVRDWAICTRLTPR